MSLKVVRFASLMLVALNLGAAFGHALELPIKRKLGPRDYAMVQSLYRFFGPVGALLEPGSVLVTAILADLVRRRRPAFLLTLVATGFLAAALAIWLAFVAPMNTRMRQEWRPEAMPSDWTRVRDQWEYAHAIRFILQLAGLGTLAASLIVETPDAGVGTGASLVQPRPSRRGDRWETDRG